MTDCFQIDLPDERASERAGKIFSRALRGGVVIYLHGNLGAGKTHFVRAALRGLNYQGYVKSPTYTLIEQYEVAGYEIYHLDLYRLAHPEELEYLGYRDLLTDQSVQFIEWPEKALGELPAPDLQVEIEYQGLGRVMQIKSKSEKGLEILDKLINLCKKLSA